MKTNETRIEILSQHSAEKPAVARANKARKTDPTVHIIHEAETSRTNARWLVACVRPI